MENSLVIGILNIVEDKLREYGIQLPAEEREDSTDPIVGYDYAELHDRILEYLQERDLINDKKVNVFSISSPDGVYGGKESISRVFASYQDGIDTMYRAYADFWLESYELGVLEDNVEFFTKSKFNEELHKYGCVCIQCLDSHINFEFSEQSLGLSRTHNGITADAAEAFLFAKDISNDVICQLINKTNTTSYGEPQAFADLSSGRYIEVTLEQEGLDESEYFFSVRLHCNEKEFGSGYFHSTVGIIDQYSSSGSSYKEIDALIKKALASHEKHPVPDACMPQPDLYEPETSRASLSEQISSAFSRVSESRPSGDREGISLFER